MREVNFHACAQSITERNIVSKMTPFSYAYIILLFFQFSKGFRLASNSCSSKSSSLFDGKVMAEAASMAVPANMQLSDALLRTLFSFKPFFSMASKKARKEISDRGMTIGVDWSSKVERLRGNFEFLSKEYENVIKKELVYPEYYKKPFHAYEDGNLCWLAALEAEAASLSVHAHVYTGSLNKLEKEGDFKLRDYFHTNMKDMLSKIGIRPSTILDIGCSTGLSTLKLHSSFPDAKIIGIDLSPFMLSGYKSIYASILYYEYNYAYVYFFSLHCL